MPFDSKYVILGIFGGEKRRIHHKPIFVTNKCWLIILPAEAVTWLKWQKQVSTYHFFSAVCHSLSGSVCVCVRCVSVLKSFLSSVGSVAHPNYITSMSKINLLFADRKISIHFHSILSFSPHLRLPIFLISLSFLFHLVSDSSPCYISVAGPAEWETVQPSRTVDEAKNFYARVQSTSIKWAAIDGSTCLKC